MDFRLMNIMMNVARISRYRVLVYPLYSILSSINYIADFVPEIYFDFYGIIPFRPEPWRKLPHPPLSHGGTSPRFQGIPLIKNVSKYSGSPRSTRRARRQGKEELTTERSEINPEEYREL
jgi:hypothetical protein